MGELLGHLLDASSAAALTDEVLQLTLAWTTALGDELLELIALARPKLPTANFALDLSAGRRGAVPDHQRTIGILQTLLPGLRRRGLLA